MIKNASPLIIYEDEQIIVCHKPAGTPTQSSHIGTSDMESLLKTIFFLHVNFTGQNQANRILRSFIASTSL